MADAPTDDDPNTPAQLLSGMTLDGGWRVLDRVDRAEGATGGFFSVQYHVERIGADGTTIGDRAFLKALDYSTANDLGVPFVEGLQMLVNAFLFERDLVAHCTSQRMTHVVRGLASGEVEVPGHGLLSTVNYLIFEEADRDIREHLDAMALFDIAWTLRALHNVANGLRQLHGVGVTHQDLKPSNVLVFPEATKVGDLGRAAWQDVPAPHDGATLAGTVGYAPPELLYGEINPNHDLRRRACDAYHLGSLVLFFFTKVGTTAGIAQTIPPELWYTQFDGTYRDALPFVRDAFDRVVEMFAGILPSWLRVELIPVLQQLCDPDPILRGNPKAPIGTARRYSMERYVTHFDHIARKAELELKSSRAR